MQRGQILTDNFDGRHNGHGQQSPNDPPQPAPNSSDSTTRSGLRWRLRPIRRGSIQYPRTMWMRVTQITTHTAGMSVSNFKMATRTGGMVATGAPTWGMKLSMNASAPQSTAKSTC